MTNKPASKEYNLAEMICMIAESVDYAGHFFSNEPEGEFIPLTEETLEAVPELQKAIDGMSMEQLKALAANYYVLSNLSRVVVGALMDNALEANNEA